METSQPAWIGLRKEIESLKRENERLRSELRDVTVTTREYQEGRVAAMEADFNPEADPENQYESGTIAHRLYLEGWTDTIEEGW